MLAINKEHMRAIRLILFLYPRGNKSDQAVACADTCKSLADRGNGGRKGDWKSSGERPVAGFSDLISGLIVIFLKIFHHPRCSSIPAPYKKRDLP